MTIGGFVDVFYNEQTGTTAYALIQGGSGCSEQITPVAGTFIRLLSQHGMNRFQVPCHSLNSSLL